MWEGGLFSKYSYGPYIVTLLSSLKLLIHLIVHTALVCEGQADCTPGCLSGGTHRAAPTEPPGRGSGSSQ